VASWKKYFKSQPNTAGSVSPISGRESYQPVFRNYQTNLPDVYIGHPNRIERYNQYEGMDMDSEINSALDILAEFCTQLDPKSKRVFEVDYVEEPTDNEVNIIKEQLNQWIKLNKLDQRLFKMVRNTLKYGDQMFIRDPETFEMHWIDMSKVVKIIVNESEGKELEQYIVKDISPNFQNLTATKVAVSDTYINRPQIGGPSGAYVQPQVPYSGGSRFGRDQNEYAIEAQHIVHLSLTEGLDITWPFGTSVLESVFKVFKQKELIEDAIIIYRVQRAPERRIFKIDVGNMPPHMAMAYVERIKNEIHQRRIPTVTGGGVNMMDATYNPLSTLEDFFFPVTAEGRGSSVDTLQGGSNVGEITDLRFFTNKLFRGLRIPSSYLPQDVEDGSQSYNDGRVGTALIQEWRFNQYCKRLQSTIIENLDKEFKMFMRWRGINIDGSLFNLKFNEPQNFAKYRQAEVDGVRINTFGQIEQLPYMSKRFMMQRYLGLTEEEIAENERLWREEKGDKETSESDVGLRAAGITPGGIESDMGAMAPPPGPEEAPPGGEVAPPAGEVSPVGGPGAAPAAPVAPAPVV
jgi:hypothetical protein